jgi:predicted DNA-binding transcriptional regulator AlpA
MGIGNWFRGLIQTKPNVHVWRERPPLEEVDALYQTPNCAPHTFYVATKRPRGHGRWSSFGQEVKLTGSGTHQEWAKNLELFFLGNKRWIVFKRDYENKHDAFAIEVYGVWIDRNTNKLEKRKIGWVDSSVNEDIAKSMERTIVIGTPSIFFYGKANPGLRFRVWIKIEEENKSYIRLRDCLLQEEGTNVAGAAKNTGFEKSQIRNWLDKLSKGEIVTARLMEALSGYRIEKSKMAGEVIYRAISDNTKKYKAKEGMTDEQIKQDPMGADIPDYVFNPI